MNMVRQRMSRRVAGVNSTVRLGEWPCFVIGATLPNEYHCYQIGLQHIVPDCGSFFYTVLIYMLLQCRNKYLDSLKIGGNLSTTSK